MIELEHLYLDGFLSYDKADFCLTDSGITNISGETGSGKSAIFEAIHYLLFGETLRKKVSVKDLINKNINKGYEILLKFKINNNDYTIKEIRGRDNDDLYFNDFSKDPTDQREKTKLETRKKISKLLGMSSEEFRSIAFLGQRASQLLIEGTSGDRGRVITEVFGLMKYDDAIKRCEVYLKETLIEKKDIGSKFDDYKQELKNLIESLVEEDTTDIVDDETLINLQTKMDQIDNKINKIRGKEAKVREALGKYEALKKNKEKINKLDEEINSLTKELKKTIKYKDSVEHFQKEINKCIRERAKIDAEVKINEEEIARLDEFGNVCPITEEECTIGIPEKFVNKRIKKCNSCIDAAKDKEDRISTRVYNNEKAINNIELYTYVTNTLENKKKLKASYEDYDFPDVEKEKKLLKKCIDSIEIGNNKHRKIQTEYNELSEKKALINQQKEFESKVKKAVDDKRNSLEELNKELKNIETESTYLSLALSIFKKAKTYKIDAILQLLNENINEILSRISNNRYKAMFTSHRKDSKGKRNLDYLDIIVNTGMIELPIGMISGGQTTMVGISVLLAVCKTVLSISDKRINNLWLDEIFGTLSNVEEVFKEIVNLSKEFNINIKLISHRELPDIFDYSWYINMEDGISKIVK
jgi:DNA repair exonuclease SbcCD ATPase subunit